MIRTSEELQERVDDLEEDLDLVDETMPDQQKGKLEKIRSVLEYAKSEAHPGIRGVKVSSREVTAATGGSRCNALDLVDEIATNRDRADVENPGGPRPKQLKIRTDGDAVDALVDEVSDAFGGEAAG